MSEYISREELIDRLRKTELSADQIRMLVYPKEAVVRAIYDCTSADVRPNIHARWEKVVTVRDDENGEPIAWHFKCSHCFNTDSRWGEYSFCPKCGCKMDREPKGEKGD